jgi:hypothetical protein
MPQLLKVIPENKYRMTLTVPASPEVSLAD